MDRTYEVRITHAADEDVREAIEHYAQTSGRAGVQRFIERYNVVIDHLEATPTAAAKIGDSGYHWLPVGSFVLVYRIDEDARTVYVTRLHYGSSNWRAEFTRK